MNNVETARQELKDMGLNPDHKARVVLRNSQKGDEINEAWAEKANRLLAVIHGNLN